MTINKFFKEVLNHCNDDTEIFLDSDCIYGATINQDFSIQTNDGDDNSPIFIEFGLDKEVAPVKHGKWFTRGGWFRCSACNNKAFLKDIGGTGGFSHEYIQQTSPYCPNCGARMDGGNDNDR